MEKDKFEVSKPQDRDPTDPKLKVAMAEMNAIFKKHDLGGYCIMISETHSEFRFFFEPTWSAIKWVDEGIRITAKQSEIGKEAAHRLIEGAASILFGVRDLMTYGFSICDKVAVMLAKNIEVDHTPFNPEEITPHREN